MIEEGCPVLPHAALRSMRGARAVGAVVEEHHDEIDGPIRPQGGQRLAQPRSLAPLAVAEIGRDLIGDVVRVEADEAHVAVREGVGAGTNGGSVPREIEPVHVVAVAIGRVPGLHFVIAERDHPGDERCRAGGLHEVRVPRSRVVAVGQETVSPILGVGHVSRVEVEGGRLRQEQVGGAHGVA
jgi:hypothetical protein